MQILVNGFSKSYYLGETFGSSFSGFPDFSMLLSSFQMSFMFSLHDEKLGKTKFVENEMAAERTDEMMDEMANGKALFAERNGERKIAFAERVGERQNIFVERNGERNI